VRGFETVVGVDVVEAVVVVAHRHGAELVDQAGGSDQRSEVANRSEVDQLVGVDDRVGARDLIAGDFERHQRNQALLWVEIERARYSG
jgi:hypothetical protein